MKIPSQKIPVLSLIMVACASGVGYQPALASIKARLGDGVKHPETWVSVFHEWLFTQPEVSRALANRTFRDLMIAYHVSPEKTEMMYNTVKL